MSFSKKGRFDPAAERSRLKNAQNIATQLQEISKQFWKVTCEAVAPASSCDAAESPLGQVLSFCDPLTAEILFVSLLGLHGLECLRMVVKLLPEKLDRGDNYDTACNLVEISDTVYCVKQLYLLYCQLR